jgi:hypothetical protein
MNNGKMINAADLIEQLAAGKSDGEIAKMFDCHPTVIARLRKTMMSVKPTIKANIAPKKDDEGPTKDYVSMRASVNCEDGSRRLLIRQLEAGQHWLDKPRFLAVVKDLGLTDRLPRELRA